ncbi:hypothetical protein PVAND_017534 [Polypedilum vanderplanki]|uniref:Lipase n=1 Tax=Polypedilum vanderplanki TaxID=319348 RepID=A0A9J6BIW2_POLVA|nr:hypothetical protein PVAND_017534 [Polypedilum vanderplanki]
MNIVHVFIGILALSSVVLGDVWEDTQLNTIQLLRKYGYTADEFTVTTSDGYRLGIHRCSGGPVSPPAPNKPVAFLMHGQLSSSADWVIMGPHVSLAYMLSDLGYDVWMGNSRGNRYSNTHVSLNNQTRAYWDFSWHEIGTIDVPTMIDFILSRTGQRNLHYIGHSMGTTVYLVMISERPTYASRLRSVNLLAPAAYMTYILTPYVRWIAAFAYTWDLMFRMMGTYYFAPTSEMDRQAAYDDCRDGAPFQEMCAIQIFLIAGWNSQETNRTMLPVIHAHSPAGASMMNMLHYAQIVRSRTFQQYDHGANNIFRYGQLRPPLYRFTGHTAPLHMFWSTNDWMATPADVATLFNRLGGSRVVDLFYRVPQIEWNHMDFVWGINVRTLVYDRMIEEMRKYD